MGKNILQRKRFFAIVSVLIVWLLLEFLIRHIHFFWPIALLLAGEMAFSSIKIFPRVKKEGEEKVFSPYFWKNKNYLFLATPFFLLAGGLSFLLFQVTNFGRQIVIFLIVFFFFLFLESLLYYFYGESQTFSSWLKIEVDNRSLKKFFLENIFTIVNLFSLFLLFSFFFSLISLFGANRFVLGLLVVGVTFLSNAQLFFVYKLPAREKNIFIFNLIISLVVLEAFFSLCLLPIGFYASGFSLLLFYYLTTNLVYFYLKNTLDKKKLRRNFLLGLFLIILLLLTVKWN